MATDVFKQPSGAFDVLREGSAAEFAGTLVGVAVTGQLMALRNDATHDLRIALRDPTQCEERRPNGVSVQHAQQAINIGLHPAFDSIPIAAMDIGRHRRDLEIVLDVDGQRVGDRRHWRFGPGHLRPERAPAANHRHRSAAIRCAA